MKNKKEVPKIGIRHLESLLLFWLLVVAIGMRVQLAIALVAMTDKTSSANPDVPVFDWTNTSTIISSFLWGYIFLQILAGNLGRIYGTKYFLIVAMAVNSILHCLIPVMATSLGSYGVMLCRCLQGMSQGFFFPSVYNLLSKWTPEKEVSVISTLILSGAPFGGIITTPIVGYISSTWYGWPWSFYLYGVAGFVWMIIYYFFGADSPDKHPTISKEEKEYILRNLEPEKGKVNLPFKKILTNVPFWVILLNSVVNFWCFQAIVSETPIYMNKVMRFDIQTNGILSSLPAIVSFMAVILSGYLSDIIINKKILSIVWSRKIFNSIGCIGSGLSLLTLALVSEDDITISVVMFVLSSGLQGMTACGAGINVLDIGPSFSGVLLGMINSTGSLVSIFGPLSVQFIVQDQTDKSQWRIIFLMAAVMYIIPAMLFLFFASADIQSFDPVKKEGNINKQRVKKTSVISVIST